MNAFKQIHQRTHKKEATVVLHELYAKWNKAYSKACRNLVRSAVLLQLSQADQGFNLFNQQASWLNPLTMSASVKLNQKWKFQLSIRSMFLLAFRQSATITDFNQIHKGFG